jgi:hypothetical protein
MQRRTHMILCMLISLLLASSSARAQQIEGMWSDSDRKNTYIFQRSNRFQFDGEVFGRHVSVNGVWETNPGLCWLGDNKRVTGNIILYVDTIQCCLSAQHLGGRLVLTEVWRKGGDVRLGQICQNRVLSPQKRE